MQADPDIKNTIALAVVDSFSDRVSRGVQLDDQDAALYNEAVKVLTDYLKGK